MTPQELARIAAAIRNASPLVACYQPLRIAGAHFPGWIATTSIVRSRSLEFDAWFPRLALDRVELGDRSVLDVGCNAGSVCLEASRSGAREVLGLDADRSIIEHASIWSALARFDGVWPLCGKIAFRADTLGDSLTDGERFDIVLCLSVLQHIRPLRRAMRWLAERARSTLVLEVQTPTPDVPHVALGEIPEHIDGAIDGETYGHGHFPTLDAFVRSLRGHGFREVVHVGQGRVRGREVLHAHR